MSATSDAERAGRAFTETRVFELLARAGYVARGVIYLLIGALAFRLAQGISGQRPSQQGALRTIGDQPFGKTLLIAMAVGLGGYAIWRLFQALIGHTPEYGRHSLGDRVGAAGSGLAYLAFCALALSELDGTSKSSSAQTKETTARVLQWPAGRELVAAAGAVFVIIAFYQAYLGLSRKFLSYSKTGAMSARTRDGFTMIGTVGIVARAVTFLLIGVFVVKAALDYDSSEAVGIDGALARLTQHAYGTAALIAVACGLIVFGLYSITDSRFRKI